MHFGEKVRVNHSLCSNNPNLILFRRHYNPFILLPLPPLSLSLSLSHSLSEHGAVAAQRYIFLGSIMLKTLTLG